jgi:ATP-dependent exoDNAse (exonuclease V) alpha subunit
MLGMPGKIEINEQFRRALDVMERTSKNVFITGRAGTGKSTLLEYFRLTSAKKIVVLAPTGVAALNVKGQTIHSFFKFKPDVTPEKVRQQRARKDANNIYQQLDALVIDEVSMVRADLLDCIDEFLKKQRGDNRSRFGGLQMILIGDLYQLPPVVAGKEREVFANLYQTPYFFSAHAFRSLEIEFVELEKVYRQRDEKFISLLNGIRNNTVSDEDIARLNTRVVPDFEPAAGSYYISLTTTNDLAEDHNMRQLDKLNGKLHVFAGEVTGSFGREYMPTSTVLQVKAGAQVMMLNNDGEGRWVNGSMGLVTAIAKAREGGEYINVLFPDGQEVEVFPYTWEIYRFFIEEGKLQSDVVGTFTQYPLMLAWAVTIHKSQGKTFERVIIDIGRGAFAHGQIYVAVSRCTSFEGMVLRKPINKNNILMDYRVVKFLTGFQYAMAEKACPGDSKMEMIEKAIRERSALKIVYLKPNDQKSSRVIQPISVGRQEFKGVGFLGLEAFCFQRRQNRMFRVDRILEIEEVGQP